MAMQYGLELADLHGYQKVQAESDNTEVISLCSGNDRKRGPSTAIYANCFSMMGRFGKVEFAHYQREANQVAHEIAKECFRFQNSCNWIDLLFF
jgi:hypothetical protein